MFEKIKRWVRHYFTTKKPFTIITDFIFFIVILLLLIPGTRKDVSAFFIRLVSLPPSELSTSETYTLNQEVENWPIETLNGSRVLFKDLRDKPIVVNFWATWCPPCRAELPGLQKLYQEYKNKVYFVFLSNEPASTIHQFITEHQYNNMPFYRYSSVPSTFSTRSIPATFIVSSEGKVVLAKKGAARWNSGKVHTLLNGLIKREK